MNFTCVNDSKQQLSDEEIPSYQLPRDESNNSNNDEENSPARLPFRMPSSTNRAVSLPFEYQNDETDVDSPVKICSAPGVLQKSSFKSLGMADKDISWASSMESIVAECSPRNDFNTIEKATFFPDPSACHSKQIQPRALYPTESNESFGIKPLDSSLNSDDIQPYKKGIRVSGVCDDFKSLIVGCGRTPAADLPNDRYDFVDRMPSSPPVFADKPETQENDLFDDGFQRTNLCNVSLRSTPTRCASPSVFSPDAKLKKNASPLKPMTPIPEGSSLEDSQLEIVLDESLPCGFSTPVKIVPKEKVEEKPQVVVLPKIQPKVKLYGVASAPNLDPIHVMEDEIVKTVTEDENGICKILSTKPPVEKTLPENKGLIPFSQLLNENNKKVLKRFGEELPISDCKKRKMESANEETTNTSSWNCPFESQAEITDSEIFKAVDHVEKSLAMEKTVPENNSPLGLIPSNSNVPETNLAGFEKNSIDQPEIIKYGNDETDSKNLTGFTTAGNKPIQPSVASLAKIRNIFEGVDDEVKDEKPINPMTLSTGFKTGGNKIIQPSAASLAKIKNIFEGVEDETKNLDTVQFSAGFKTGGNKIIKPSAAALAKMKNIFDGVDDEVKNEKPVDKAQFSTGFKTGGNKIIQPSAASLAKIKNIFEGVDDEMNEEKPAVSSTISAGFKTGGNKIIQPSAASLARSRNIFDGVDDEVKDEKPADTVKFSAGFKTGGNKLIQPSKSSLAKIQKIFDGVDDEVKNLSTSSNKSKFKPPEKSFQNISNISKNITNERIENETVSVTNESYSALLENTDWDETPWNMSPRPNKTINDSAVKPALKRQSSPVSDSSKRRKIGKDLRSKQEIILSKRQAARESQARIAEEKRGTERSIKGSHFLKKEMARQKTWREFLPEGPKNYETSQLKDFGVFDSVLNVDFDNARDFRFSAKDYYSPTLFENNTSGLTIGDGFSVILDEENSFGVEEIKSAFLAGPGIDPQLVPSGWVSHHYRLLVWKLACYERSCGEKMAGSALNPDSVMFQLKYRYDREIDRSQSSALKRILERNDASEKPLVLTVLRITQLVEGNILLLTDGWYTCPAHTDCALNKAIISGKVRVGTKIMTISAQLVGCEQGIAPLEITDGVFLKIATNSTRRVRWFHKMGFQKLKSFPSIPLTSILPGGGNISLLRVAVVRVYPLVFVEKTSEGRSVTRNFRSEQKASMSFQNNLETEMTKLSDQIESDMNGKSFKRLNLNSRRIQDIDSPEKLYSLLATADDPGSIEAQMTEEQKNSVLQYRETRRIQNNRLMEDQMKNLKMSSRSVRSVFRVRLVDLKECETAEESALLSFWQPNEDLTSVFTEGSVINLFNVTSAGSRNNQQMLNSTRKTSVELIPGVKKAIPNRTVLRAGDIGSSFTPIWDELDIVGLVVQVQEVKGSAVMQTVYLTDTDQQFFELIFWHGLKEYCCDDIIAEGLIVGISNVQWRNSSADGPIPRGFVTETTQFALTSKSALIQSAINALKEELDEEDIAALIEQSQEAIAVRLSSGKLQANVPLNVSCNSNAGVSDVSGNASDDADASPVPRPRYLNGFVHFPQAASTPVKSRNSVQWRVEQLQQTGQPPPLSPIAIPINKKKLSRAFKLPTITETSSNESR